MPLVRALPKDLAQGRTRGPAQILGNLSGGAEPRLTSDGEAGVDGVKFRDRPLFSRRYLTSGGKAGTKSA